VLGLSIVVGSYESACTTFVVVTVAFPKYSSDELTVWWVNWVNFASGVH